MFLEIMERFRLYDDLKISEPMNVVSLELFWLALLHGQSTTILAWLLLWQLI